MTHDEAKTLWDELNWKGRTATLRAADLRQHLFSKEFDELPPVVQQLLIRRWTEETLTPFNMEDLE